MSRKRLKGKRRCYPLCKPHKRRQAQRWTAREANRLEVFEKARRTGDWTTL